LERPLHFHLETFHFIPQKAIIINRFIWPRIVCISFFVSELGGRLVVLFAIRGTTTYCYVGLLWDGLSQSNKLGAMVMWGTAVQR
jgi:hypothetical protein